MPTEKPTFATIPFPSLLGGATAAPATAPAAAKPPRPYSVRDTYAAGDRVEHPVFGVGPVTEVQSDNKIAIAFPDGVTRVLVHRIGALVDGDEAVSLDVGDEVEAYCPSPRCKSDTAHTIISMYEDEIRRVQCVTCGEVHAFRKPRGETPAEDVAEQDADYEVTKQRIREIEAKALAKLRAGRDANLSRSMDELELSVRTANSLHNAGIRYVGELVQQTEAGLASNNFGARSLAELNEVLAELGLRLGMDVGDWSAP